MEKRTKFLMATHGDLAKGFVETLHMIAGDDYEVACYCMPKDRSGDDLERDLRDLMEDWRENRYIVFTDLLGGSVNNTLTAMLLGGMDFQLVTGTNLAMLLGVVMAEPEEMNEAIAEAIEQGRNGMVHINKKIEEME